MSVEPVPFEPREVERRREILYGTPGTTIYRGGNPVLWIPDDFGSLTESLSYQELEKLMVELKIVGVNRDATADNIEEAFHQLALRYHSDRNPDNSKEAEEGFEELNEVYEILSFR